MRGTKVPDRPEWLHEIKHVGYRLIPQREGKRVRLFTRNGYEWSHRFPLVLEAALRNRQTYFVIDGEAVLLGVDGRTMRKSNSLPSTCWRAMVTISVTCLRKSSLCRLLARRVDGSFLRQQRTRTPIRIAIRAWT
nr:hypothetical protein [Bradyrhizobium lablabi]